jgi:hypothetical protein
MTTGRINQVTIETDRPAVRPASPAAAVASPSLLRVPIDPNDAELPYGSRVAFFPSCNSTLRRVLGLRFGHSSRPTGGSGDGARPVGRRSRLAVRLSVTPFESETVKTVEFVACCSAPESIVQDLRWNGRSSSPRPDPAHGDLASLGRATAYLPSIEGFFFRSSIRRSHYHIYTFATEKLPRSQFSSDNGHDT